MVREINLPSLARFALSPPQITRLATERLPLLLRRPAARARATRLLPDHNIAPAPLLIPRPRSNFDLFSFISTLHSPQPPHLQSISSAAFELNDLILHQFPTPTFSKMPPKAQKTPTTGGKAPAGKAPAEKKEAGKKTAAPSGEKKKRTKSRKETYSSYIYKGESPGPFSHSESRIPLGSRLGSYLPASSSITIASFERSS